MSLATAVLLAGCTARQEPVAPDTLRIVSLHDTTTEMVVLLDRTALLVSITEPRFLSDAAAAAVADLPRLPGGAVSAEAIVQLRPALVLGTDVVAEQQPSLGAALEAMGVETWFIDPDGLDGLWSTMEALGDRLGAQAEARAWVSSARDALPEPVTDAPVDVFLYDCCDPPFTAGGRAPATELIRRMGGRNIFGDQDSDWLTVSWEAVAEADPALIVVHDYPWEGQGGVAEKQALLRAHPLAARTRAVQTGQLLSVPLALTLEGPRTLELPALLGPALARARAAQAGQAGAPEQAPAAPAQAAQREAQP